jgi:predicted nucleotidyltransferase
MNVIELTLELERNIKRKVDIILDESLTEPRIRASMLKDAVCLDL